MIQVISKGSRSKMVEESESLRIGIYPGSFDPFHKGHLEVALVALKYVDQVIIVPNNPNHSKPYRNDLNFRTQIIKLSIHEHPRISVTETSIEEIHLTDKHRLVGIIGSDSCRREPKTKVHEWLVIPRTGYSIPEGSLSWSVPVHCLCDESFSQQQWSSTYIRRQIMTGNLKNLPLCNKDVLTYIQENSLYDLKTQVSRMMPGTSIVKIKNGVVLVNNEKIVKAFPTKESFVYERNAYIKAKELGLPIPKFLFEYDESLIGIEYTGQSLVDAVKSGECPYELGYSVGHILKHCHTLEVTYQEKSELCQNRKIQNIINSGHVSGLNLIDPYLYNPGPLGYCHGDASVANFTYDLSNQQICMIDFSGLSKMGAYGIPAYEYYQFLISIKSHLIKDDDIDQMTNGFIDGYGETGFTSEADTLFSVYWNRM